MMTRPEVGDATVDSDATGVVTQLLIASQPELVTQPDWVTQPKVVMCPAPTDNCSSSVFRHPAASRGEQGYLSRVCVRVV
jgi:hypothetical protein